MTETLEVLAGRRSNGSRVYEEIAVESLRPGQYRLLQSPGLVLGMAADDVFEVRDDLSPVVTRRGSNLCVQVYLRTASGDVEGALTPRMSALGGRLDGKSSHQLVYTVPVTAGFSSVETELDKTVAEFPAIEWFYGNVYDPSDGVTPLNWW